MTPASMRAITETAELLKDAKRLIRTAVERGATQYGRVALRTIRQDIDGMLLTLEELRDE